MSGNHCTFRIHLAADSGVVVSHCVPVTGTVQHWQALPAPELVCQWPSQGYYYDLTLMIEHSHSDHDSVATTWPGKLASEHHC
jgi:hypothetical protein